MVSLGSGRALTVLAVGFLALDGILLALAGLWLQRAALLLVGAGLVLVGGMVLIYWRRHRRRLAEIQAVRQEIREEARALREILRGEQ